MKNLFLTSIGSLLIGALAAQSPVITASNVHLIGDQTPIAWCSNSVEPGDAGVDVTWDFSNLVESEEQIFDYVEPSTSVFGYQFPNATLCAIGDNNYQSFYRLTDDFLTIEGYAGIQEGTSDTLKILYSDVEELLPIPFEYGDTHLDTFEGVSQAMGFDVNFTGEIDLEVDGYGTLILPNGTYDDAIRYHFTRSQDNTIFGQTTTTTKEQWGWMSANHRFWLCLMETNNDGFGTEDIVWYSKNPLVLNVSQMEVEHIALYPNPLQSNRTVHFQSDCNSEASIQLRTIDGKLIISSAELLTIGENELKLNDDIPAGIYTLSIVMNKKRLISRLVVQ